uniref:Uncharacterized protein n=1 Tax=Nelumbo nucifera TaxID=4432 RepID=A0A822XHT9_NELNU|nr:TPA_asm: hypothetical protein HUJ06_019838 [Nelumbo nucifera]
MPPSSQFCLLHSMVPISWSRFMFLLFVLTITFLFLFQVFEESEANDDELLKSDAENIRRQKFEAILKLQQENSGLIEPKRNEVLLPGMFLPESVRPPTTSTEAAVDPQPTDPTCTSKPETISSDSSNKPSTSEHKNFAMRKKSRARNPKKQIKEWVKKEHVTGE